MRRNKRALFSLCAFLAFSGIAFSQEKPDALKLFRENRFEDARKVCLLELEQDPQNMDSYVVLCRSLIALNRWADAELYANKAYSQLRKDPRIVEILGEANYFLGKNQQAMDYFVLYINQLPDGTRIATAYSFLSEIYLRTDRLNHADIAMRTALQYEPNNVAWWTRLGFIRERIGDFRYAVEAYEAALKITPNLDDAVRGRNRALAKIRG